MNKNQLATEIMTAKLMTLAEVQRTLIEEIDSIEREINTGRDFTIFGEPIAIKKYQLAGVTHALEIIQAIEIEK